MENSYYDLINNFYDLLQSNPLSQSAQLLYHTLLMINNKCRWTEWFQRTNESLIGLTRINKKTLINARNELKQYELIEFIPSKKKGDITKYKILGCKIGGLIYTKSDTLSDTQSNTLSGSHNKTKEEEKEKGGYTSMNEVTTGVTSKQNVVSLVPYEKMVKTQGKPAIETTTVTQESNKDIDNINNIYINSSSSSLLISDSEKQKDKKTEEEETINTTPKTYNIKAIRALSKRYCDNVKNWCGFVGATFG